VFVAVALHEFVRGLVSLAQVFWCVGRHPPNPAQLSPDAYRGAANLLELPNAPCSRPSLDTFGRFDGGLSVEVVAHVLAVDSSTLAP